MAVDVGIRTTDARSAVLVRKQFFGSYCSFYVFVLIPGQEEDMDGICGADCPAQVLEPAVLEFLKGSIAGQFRNLSHVVFAQAETDIPAGFFDFPVALAPDEETVHDMSEAHPASVIVMFFSGIVHKDDICPEAVPGVGYRGFFLNVLGKDDRRFIYAPENVQVFAFRCHGFHLKPGPYTDAEEMHHYSRGYKQGHE